MFGFLNTKNTPNILRQQEDYLSRLIPATRGEHSLPQQDFPYKGYCRGEQFLERDGLLVAMRGQPHWQNGSPISATADAVAAAFRKQDTAFISNLCGGFSLAILDLQSGSAILAVDKMGIEPMAYSANAHSLVLSNNAESVAHFPGVGSSLRHQAFFEYLYMHIIPSPGTIFENVAKLPPASLLRWNNGEYRCETYWVPEFESRSGFNFRESRDSLHAGLERAIVKANPDESTGAFLSGGLDSSSVVGKLSQLTAQPAKTFSIGFGETEFDELRYARISNKHFGCESHEYHVAPADIVSAFPIVAKAFDEPFGNSSAVPTYCCAKLAAECGVNHLLAGDGGDELFGGNERYARQGMFELYSRVPRALRVKVLDPWSQRISSNSRIMPLRKIRSYIEQANVPLPDRFETWNLIYREAESQLLAPEFAASINVEAPLELLRDIWNSYSCNSLLDHMLFYDWRLTLADNDLRKVGTMCESAGVRVSYPMLHEDVVNVSIQVPPAMKMTALRLRTFYKKAMRGFLPAEVLRKKKHGFGLPFGIWLKTDAQLADLIYTNLFDLKKRKIVSASFLDRLIEAHRNGHPSYYGYVIWDLAILEEWLKNHADSF